MRRLGLLALISIIPSLSDGLGYCLIFIMQNTVVTFFGGSSSLLQRSANSNLEKSSNYSYSVLLLSIIADLWLTGGVFASMPLQRLKTHLPKIGGVWYQTVKILILVFNFSYDGLAGLAATCLLFLLVTSSTTVKKAIIGKVFHWLLPPSFARPVSVSWIALLLFNVVNECVKSCRNTC